MNTDYRVATTVNEITEYVGTNTIVAFDYEVAPDEAYRNDRDASLDPHRSHITTMSLSVQAGTGIMIPVAHLSGQNIDPVAFFAWQKAFLTDPHIIKIAHNLSYEAMFAYANGIVIQEPVYDTIAASQLSLHSDYEYRKLSDSGLKTLATELFDEPLPSYSVVTNSRHFDELDPADPETIRYSCADADIALRLYHLFNSWFDRYLPKHREIVEKVEAPTAVYLGIMKYNGVPIDIDLLEAKGREAEVQMKMIRKKIASIIGDVKIGTNASTVEFKDYLFQDLGLPILKTTNKNKEAADDQTMQLLKEWCDVNRPELSELFTLVQEYRKWSKIKTTYIDGYKKCIHPVTGRIHPSFFQLSTETGRLSCARPNMQNTPRPANDPLGIRKMIKAPDGHVILSLDFSQIELRVGAVYCGDEKMLQTYRDGDDIHAMTTSVIFGIPYEQAKNKNDPNYKERRAIAKNTNFGVFYGLFPRGLQNTLKFKAEIDKTYEECQEIIDNIKAGYPALARWQADTKQEAARHIYSETWLGRRRYLPTINSSDWKERSFAERCALNTPIQGTAADIMKLAMGRIVKGLPKHPELRPIMQIHDEVVFLVSENQLESAVRFVKECMEDQPFPGFDIPLVAEASVGQDYGSMTEMENI